MLSVGGAQGAVAAPHLQDAWYNPASHELTSQKGA